jgi:hypothetical protein
MDFPLFHYLTLLSIIYIVSSCRRRVEQLAARRAHNPEVTGSSPVPAKLRIQSSNPPITVGCFVSTAFCQDHAPLHCVEQA